MSEGQVLARNKPRAILIRLDKIGDLICTIPVDQMTELQSYEVYWVISSGLGFIPKNASPNRFYLELNKAKAWASFVSLLKLLTEKKPSLAISFQAPWWVSLALWLSRVPRRAGVKSQWHSFLFLNAGLRQKRSLAEKHEADYNADLVRWATERTADCESLPSKKSAAYLPTPILKLVAPNENSIQKWGLEKNKYLVIHPGMAGSALNWEPNRFAELLGLLLSDESLSKIKFAITGTLADEPWLTPLKGQYANHDRVLILQNQLSAEELLSVLSNSLLVLAPSTGVLHLASSLGVTCLGLYSPIRVQHPKRWQARGPSVQIFFPDVPCPATFSCLKFACAHYPCLEKISPHDMALKIKENIETHRWVDFS